MELLQLQYFCDSAQTENFSHTAQRFHIPPSAVSQTIKRLESDLGVSLFDRQHNKITLNEHGKILYEYVSKALDLLEEGRTRLRDADGDPSGEIRLLICTNRRLVTRAIERFQSQYPSVSFLLDHQANDGIDYDVIISDDLSLGAKRQARRLLTERMLLAVHEDHPLAKKERVSLSELSEESFVAMHESSRLYCLTKKICEEAGFTPKIAIRCDDPYYVRQYVALGLGVCLVPEISWKNLLPPHVVLKSMGCDPRVTYAFLKTNGYRSRACECFLDILFACCEEE